MRAVLALILAGCGFRVAPSGVSDDQPIDASLGVGADACASFSSQLDTCGKAGADVTLSGTLTLNTDSGELLQGTTPIPITTGVVATTSNQLEVRAWYVGALTLSANTQLRAVGSRPLAIIASGKVSFFMGAVIDVSAGGAGASTACSPSAIKGADDNGGAAGGGGGGAQGAGGKGGDGNKDGAGSAGGAGGPKLMMMPAGPLGGCPGAPGGIGGDDGGEAGAGGGAIYIASASEIELLAMSGINAGGGGGGGGKKVNSQFGDAGGGGGGSGGMIFLEAPRVRSAGTLAANGGGGGEASGNGSAGDPGDPGALSSTRAEGGKGGSSTGSDGGRGAAGSTLDGETAAAPQNGGGGGGGGGAGYVRVRSADAMLGASVSPAASQN